MPKAPKYLEQNYPNKEIEELNLTNQDLEGSLTIKDFPNLETVRCGNNSLISIELINLPKLKLFNANINQLTDLTINKCPNIVEFNVANNLLTDTSFLNNLNPENLNCLSIHSNNFSKQNLSFLSRFVNLEKLFIDNNDRKKFSEGKCNHFTGSLQPLQNLTKLKWLNIANTDINFGLEYLSDSARKICLINSWERKNAGYLDIKWEMERAVRFEKVREKLQQVEEKEPSFAKDWYRINPWRQARGLYGEDAFKRYKAQDWLNEKYPSDTNLQFYKELDLRDKNLVGELDLSSFIGLEKLDCSYNQLTNLNLSECKNLTELNCGNNNFTSLDFLQAIPNKENLKALVIEKNQNLSPQNLDFSKEFTKLHILDLSDNEFKGNLEPLKDIKELKLLDISRTDIEGGLEYLSDSCRGLYCDPETKKQSVKVADILAKYQTEKREDKEYFKEEKYFNLAKWREELRSNIILSIPLERLFVIRSNIKKFVEKWKKAADKNLYDKSKQFFSEWVMKKEKSNLSELSNLQSPEQFEINWYWTIPQWAGRGAVGVSGLLSFFYDYEIGAIAVASPIVETVTSYAKQNLYEKKAEKWDEFTQDIAELLDNYHELKGILESLKGYKVGTVDEALKDLDNKSETFLKSYDTDSNDTVDLYELQVKKGTLAKDLVKENIKEGSSQLGGIFQAIKELEGEVNKYRRGFYYGTVEENEKTKVQIVLERNAETLKTEEKEEYQAHQEVVVDLDKYYEK